MFENLTNSDVLILGGLIGIIILIGVICIVLTIKGGKKESSKKNVSRKKDAIEPDIHIALATEDIPDIEVVDEEKNMDEVVNVEPMEEIPVMIQNNNPADYLSAVDYTPAQVPVDEPEYTLKEEISLPKEDINISFNTSLTDFESISYDESIEQKQDEKNATSIEEVLKAMQEDLEKQKYAEIDRYEEEQEENAVISYQELIARRKALEPEDIKEDIIEEVKEKPSYLKELEDFELPPLKPIPDKDESRPFLNSEFVSPIFGRLEDKAEYPTVKKTVVETEELTQTEILPIDDIDISSETDDFLNTLKEFRKNL